MSNGAETDGNATTSGGAAGGDAPAAPSQEALLGRLMTAINNALELEIVTAVSDFSIDHFDDPKNALEVKLGKKPTGYVTSINLLTGDIRNVISPDYAAGHQMMDAFRERFVAAGGEIVGEAFPPLQGTKDYGSYLTAAKASGAEAAFVFFAGGAAITFVKQYHEFGLAKDLPLYGAGFLTSAAYVHVQGPAADGIVAPEERESVQLLRELLASDEEED